jgi:hypothetical protein
MKATGAEIGVRLNMCCFPLSSLDPVFFYGDAAIETAARFSEKK